MNVELDRWFTKRVQEQYDELEEWWAGNSNNSTARSSTTSSVRFVLKGRNAKGFQVMEMHEGGGEVVTELVGVREKAKESVFVMISI